MLDPLLPREKSLKKTLIQVFVSLGILVIAPFILQPISPEVELPDGFSDFSYIRAEVATAEEVEELNNEFDNSRILQQDIRVIPLEGPEKGTNIDVVASFTTKEIDGYKREDQLILFRSEDEFSGVNYSIYAPWRFPRLIIIAILFIIGVLIIAGLRGLSALSGLLFSLIFIQLFLIPHVINGTSLALIVFITSVVTITISLFMAHGYSRTTLVSAASSSITILISLVLSLWFVDWLVLTGNGSEESLYLLANQSTRGINLRGLYTSGIIIGTLGILDDITTAQASAIKQISRANSLLTPRQLFSRGMEIGREHILSLVNTLALAYVGGSLPLLLLFTVNSNAPWWIIINEEYVSEEIIRTLVGSFSLLLAVPITTLIASYVLKFKNSTRKPELEQSEQRAILADFIQ